jgi:hypothetical protein
VADLTIEALIGDRGFDGGESREMSPLLCWRELANGEILDTSEGRRFCAAWCPDGGFDLYSGSTVKGSSPRVRMGSFELDLRSGELRSLAPDGAANKAVLRVLQEREFERVGGRDRIRVDVRVIAATNRDLPAAVAAGAFRQDLFYRLNVFPLEMPPLRERREDIPVLVEYFIARYARKAGKTFRRVAKRTLDCLRSYPWPGNIRELQNVIERSVIVSDTEEFTVDESWLSTRPQVDSRFGLSGTVTAHEKAIVEDALRASGGRVFGPSGAAARLGIPRSTLESKIRALKINKSRFRTRGPQSP